MLTLLLLTNLFACIEPPPTATEGGTEPSGAAKPGAPEPGEGPPAAADATGEGALDDAPNPAAVPEPHDGSPPGAPKPQFTQDALADGVSLNLSLACEGCTGSLLVRIENATSTPPTLSTQKAFDAPGTGTIMAPRRSTRCSWWSTDKNGQPTPGERIGIWTGGLLKTSEAPDLIELEVGKVPDEPPLPG